MSPNLALSAPTPPSRRSVEGDRAPGSIADAALPGDLEDHVFSLVFRQMHALWGRHRADFDDLVQSASEQAIRALPSFQKRSALSTWTYQICYRTVIRHRRWSMRWLRRFTLDAPEVEPVECAADAGTELERRERSRRLHGALDQLSDKRRAVIVLRDLEGLEMDAVAEIVGTSEATVRSRLRDARRQLADLLATDPYFGDEACAAEALP